MVQDSERAKDYKVIKTLIDNYHKVFIEEVLSVAHFDWGDLAKATEDYQKDKISDEELGAVQKAARQAIKKTFEKYNEGVIFKTLNAPTPNDLFKDKDFLVTLNKSEQNVVDNFKRFSTYFTGFQENRRNIYSDEEIATSIPNRVVNENFPKFFQNVKVFEELKKLCPEVLKTAEGELSKVLCGKGLDEVFSIDNFNAVLSQSGIDFYNQVIGGVSGKEGSVKTRGINECANQFWQQNPEFAKTHKKIKLLPLFKQILSDRATLSFVANAIESDKELFAALEDFQKSLMRILAGPSLLQGVASLLRDASNDTLSCIFINKKDIAKLSQMLFENCSNIQKWSELQRRMNFWAKATFSTKQELSRYVNESISEDGGTGRKSGCYSLKELNNALEYSSADGVVEKTQVRMQNYLDASEDFISDVEQKYQSVLSGIEKLKAGGTFLRDEKGVVALIKDYLDCVQDYYWRFKIFNVTGSVDKDSDFYEAYDEVLKVLSLVAPLYNRVRNYLTKKNGSAGKYKLNFESPTLAAGWDLNKESANSCVILLKDDKYYLGIINPKNKVDFSKLAPCEEGVPSYKKMVYKLLPGAYKEFPLVFFAAGNKELYKPSKALLDNYEKGAHKKGESFSLQFCHELIDFFKSSIQKHPDWSKFGFKEALIKCALRWSSDFFA